MHLARPQQAPGMRLAWPQHTLGMHLACVPAHMWHVPGMHLAWPQQVPGMHLACIPAHTWHVPGMHLACTRHGPSKCLASAWHALGSVYGALEDFEENFGGNFVGELVFFGKQVGDNMGSCPLYNTSLWAHAATWHMSDLLT